MADIGEGIDENTDTITALTLAPRNALVALWHGTNEIIPTIADGLHGFKQKYTLEDRTDLALEGTRNSLRKIFHNIKEQRVFGTLSAVLAEATDGPVDDALHVIGSSNTVIKPVESFSQKSETQFDMAA